jgi:hypothetical protein
VALDTPGILTPIDFGAEQPTVLTAVEREIFVNEAPLWARLPHRPASSQVYSIVSYDVRQATHTLNALFTASTADIDITLTDATPIMVGDVLEILDTAGTASERVEVVSLVSSTVVNVRRAREGTTVIANDTTGSAASKVVRLIGNSRTGGEVDQQAYRPVRTSVEQYVQTVQYPVQIGGLADAIGNVVLPPGAASVFGQDRAVKLVDAIRETERSMYYGTGEKPAATGDRAKMKGLQKLIAAYNSGANVKTNAGASYTRAGFLADTVAKIYAAGGMADVILCSTDFLTGLDTWVPSKTAMMGSGTTTNLGFPITTFVLPLNAQPLTFVPSLGLRQGTAVVLTSMDLDVRYIREMMYKPRGSRGDAIEGEWIGDFCINLNRPSWHAWVSGITSYA